MASSLLAKEQKLLPVYVLKTNICDQGICERKPGDESPAQITLCLEGKGKFSDTENNEYTLVRGNVFILNKNAPCSYYPISKNWKVLTITFDGYGVDNIMEYAGLKDVTVTRVRSVQMFEKLYTYMYYIHKEKSNIASHVITSPIIYGILLRVGKMHNTKPPELGKYGQKVERLFPAVLKMFDNFGDDLSPAILAKEIGVSEIHFNRLFHEVYGMAPMMYLRNIRMFYAQHELCRNKAISIDTVARNAGFTSTSYFCKCFKEKFGETPKHFQENHDINELVGIDSILGI